jgi:membrane AbrB-like protein
MRKLSKQARFWAATAAVFGTTLTLLALVGAPAAVLIAAALAGCSCALTARQPRHLPEAARSVGLAILAVAAGSHVDGDVLDVLLHNPFAVITAVVATLGVSLAAGQVLRLGGAVNVQTALLAGVAGGASGAAAMARELGADEPMVLALQYLRVLVVLGTLPVVASILGAHPADQPAVEAGGAGLPFTVTAVVIGLALTRVLRFSGNRMVLPLAVATTLSVSGAFPNTEVPGLVLDAGNAVIGLMVGLSFTRAALRRLSGVLPLALVQVVTSIAGAALFGALLADVAGVTAVDGYLATTPGGLPTVTGIAVGADVDVGFVVTAQVLRMLMAMLLAALLGVWIGRRRRSETGESRP